MKVGSFLASFRLCFRNFCSVFFARVLSWPSQEMADAAVARAVGPPGAPSLSSSSVGALSSASASSSSGSSSSAPASALPSAAAGSTTAASASGGAGGRGAENGAAADAERERGEQVFSATRESLLAAGEVLGADLCDAVRGLVAAQERAGAHDPMGLNSEGGSAVKTLFVIDRILGIVAPVTLLFDPSSSSGQQQPSRTPPAKRTAAGDMPGSSQRKRGKKKRSADATLPLGPDTDIFELLHSPNSPLTMVDLREVISFQNFDLLSSEDKDSLLPYLANRDRESADTVRSLFFSQAFRDAIDVFQQLLTSGVLNVGCDADLPAWVTDRLRPPPGDTEFRPNARMQNEWKAAHFEEYWGQRRRPQLEDADWDEPPPFSFAASAHRQCEELAQQEVTQEVTQVSGSGTGGGSGVEKRARRTGDGDDDESDARVLKRRKEE
jgi:Asx homology domain